MHLEDNGLHWPGEKVSPYCY